MGANILSAVATKLVYSSSTRNAQNSELLQEPPANRHNSPRMQVQDPVSEDPQTGTRHPLRSHCGAHFVTCLCMTCLLPHEETVQTNLYACRVLHIAGTYKRDPDLV